MGDDFLIGYRITVNNAQATHENLSVSKSMMPCNGIKAGSLTFSRKPSELLEKTLKDNEDEFLIFFAQQTLHLQSHQKIETQKHHSRETLTLPTHCYAVEFNDDTATITLLQ